ncbi:MAG: hypothetical protein E6342_15370 [Clostridium sp.]|uniref:hypothetical protein n=1 Tax=Clostridium TaxID=1485 RepID=UPI00290396E7|nr:hypothetical protein [Clostridium sp.]MDU1280019.1 hypothetical protein [Clostridium sp.]MDU7089085.1 hypothetical protein [Clostridium sp.]
MNLNLNIINYSNSISTNELNDCLILLPKKYKDLNTKIIIFDTFSRYIFYSLRHFNFIYFFGGIIEFVINYFYPSTELGCYNIGSRTIYIFENRILEMLENKLSTLPNKANYNKFKDYITSKQINYYKFSWSKYVLLDCIVHELTHAIQHKEKRLPSRFKYLVSKWSTVDIEFEAVSNSIDIFNTNHTNFLNILGVTGIKSSHSLYPLNINYKFNIKIG